MKKIVLMCLALAMGAGVATAAKPAAGKKIVTTVFVTDIDCEHCVKKIMNNVPSLGRGVEEVEVDLATKEVKVTYDASKNNEAQLVKGFASLKVKAEPKPAEEERK
jgi:copper chaperone CopZ